MHSRMLNDDEIEMIMNHVHLIPFLHDPRLMFKGIKYHYYLNSNLRLIYAIN